MCVPQHGAGSDMCYSNSVFVCGGREGGEGLSIGMVGERVSTADVSVVHLSQCVGFGVHECHA
jgi:hypothetical protein